MGLCGPCFMNFSAGGCAMKKDFEAIIKAGWAAVPAAGENLFAQAPSEKAEATTKQETLLLAVDMQNDFMEGGALGVKGALADSRRLSRFLYDNAENIETVAVTLDTHEPLQIFHSCWWHDPEGREPEPFTVITAQDLDAGRWLPACEPEASRTYLLWLAEKGHSPLCIWPYHCLGGTVGCALEPGFANMVFYHSVARRSPVLRTVKGTLRTSEFYGAIRPEYSPEGLNTNHSFREQLMQYKTIIVAGEAMDYCLYETLKQLFEESESRAQRVLLLEDCTSSIGPRAEAEARCQRLAKEYGLELVKSTDRVL